MKLFEMFATLSLDTSEFESGATEAIAQSGEIEKAINSINTDSIDAEIAALDKEISDLDSEIHKLEMGNLDADIAATDKEIATLEKDIASLDSKSAIVEGVINGLVDVGLELVERGIESLIEFGAESLEIVANSGTAVGNELKQAQTDYEVTMQALRLKTGQTIAPIAASFYELAEFLSGVSRQEKVDIMLSNINSYSFENLENVQDSLRNIFGVFEEYEPTKIEELTSVESMTSGLESQIAYWESYDSLIKQLQARGVSADFLAQYADGSQDSYDTLRAMGRASDEELAALENTYNALETARTDAAKTISEAQLSVDDTVTEMIDTVARIATEVSEIDAGDATTEVIQGMINAMSAQYPYVSAWVDTINAKVGSLGVTVKGLSPTENLINQGFVTNTDMMPGVQQGLQWAIDQFVPKAIGMDYVPEDNYPALLHEGEAVLTKPEATVWRRGESGGSGDLSWLPGAITSAVRNGLQGMQVLMDGETVGNLVTNTISENLMQQAWEERYST